MARNNSKARKAWRKKRADIRAEMYPLYNEVQDWLASESLVFLGYEELALPKPNTVKATKWIRLLEKHDNLLDEKPGTNNLYV